jgi:hypothetical protein
VSTLPSDGWRLRAHGLRRALASLLAESLATHQPVRADLGRLELLRLFEADVVHAFGLSRPRASALLPSIVSLEDDAVPAGGAAEAARRARALLCDDDRQRARLLARLDLDPARVHVCARVEDDDGRAVAAQLGRLYDASLDAAW